MYLQRKQFTASMEPYLKRALDGETLTDPGSTNKKARNSKAFDETVNLNLSSGKKASLARQMKDLKPEQRKTYF